MCVCVRVFVSVCVCVLCVIVRVCMNACVKQYFKITYTSTHVYVRGAYSLYRQDYIRTPIDKGVSAFIIYHINTCLRHIQARRREEGTLYENFRNNVRNSVATLFYYKGYITMYCMLILLTMVIKLLNDAAHPSLC